MEGHGKLIRFLEDWSQDKLIQPCPLPSVTTELNLKSDPNPLLVFLLQHRVSLPVSMVVYAEVESEHAFTHRQ